MPSNHGALVALVVLSLTAVRTQARTVAESTLIGFWTTAQPGTDVVANVILEPGRFSSTGRVGKKNLGTINGKWFVRDNVFVWVYDNNPSAEDPNPIVEFTPGKFKLKEVSGRITTFTRVSRAGAGPRAHEPFSHYNLASDNLDDCVADVREELKRAIKEFDPHIGFTCEAGLARSIVSSPDSPLSRDPLRFVSSYPVLFGLPTGALLDLRQTRPGGALQSWKEKPVAGAYVAWGTRYNLMGGAPYFYLDTRLADLETGAPRIVVFVDEQETAFGEANAGIRMGVRLTREGPDGYGLHLYLQNVSSRSIAVPYFPEESGRLAALGLNEQPPRPAGSKVALIAEAALAPGESLSFVHALEASAAPWLGGGGVLRVTFDPSLFKGGSTGLWKHKIESGETRLAPPGATEQGDGAFAGWWAKAGGPPRHEAFNRFLKKSLQKPDLGWPEEAYLKAAAVLLRLGDWPAVISIAERRIEQRDDFALAMAGFQKNGPWAEADAAFRKYLKANTMTTSFGLRDILLAWKGPTVMSAAFLRDFRKEGAAKRHRAFGAALLRQGRAGLAVVELERANALGDISEGLYASLLESTRLSGDEGGFKRAAAVARAAHPDSRTIRKAVRLPVVSSPTAANALRYPQWLAWSVPKGMQVAGDLSTTNVVWSNGRLVYVRTRINGNAQVRSLDLETGRLAWDADLDQGILAAERFGAPKGSQRYRTPGRVVAEDGKIGIAYVEMVGARSEQGVLWLDADTGYPVAGGPRVEGVPGARDAFALLQKHPRSPGMKAVAGRNLTAVAAVDDTLFVADALPRLRSIDCSSGEFRETLPLDAKCVHLLQAEKDVVAILEGGEVFRADGKSLRTVWKTKFDLKPVAAPAIQGGDLLTLDGRFLSAMSLATGAMRWRYPATDNSAIAAPGPAAAVWTGFDARIIGVRPPEGFEDMRAAVLDAVSAQEDPALAQELLETALDADPSHAGAYVALARLSQKATLSPEAKARLEGHGELIVATSTETAVIADAIMDKKSFLWSARTGRVTGLVSDDKRVYVLGADALRALDITTGKEAWKLALGDVGVPFAGRADRRLSLEYGLLYASAGQTTLKAVDSRDGRELWSRNMPPKSICCASLLSPRIFGRDLYAEYSVHKGEFSEYGFLRIAKFDGSIRWSSTWKTEERQHSYMASASYQPAFAGRIVFFATGTGGLRALERDTGKTIWTHQLPKASSQDSLAFSDPVSDERAVYAAGGDGAVYAFDAATGKVLWKSIQGGENWHGPAVGSLMKAGNRLCFCHYNHNLVCLNVADGTEAWKKKGFSINYPPVVLNGLLWVANSTTLSAMDPATGELRAEESFPFVRHSLGLTTDGRFLYLAYEDSVAQIRPFVPVE